MKNLRSEYVKKVKSALKSGGIYLSACFSEEESKFPGTGKIRETFLGTQIYLSSLKELHELFAADFEIIEQRSCKIPGKVNENSIIFTLCRKT